MMTARQKGRASDIYTENRTYTNDGKRTTRTMKIEELKPENETNENEETATKRENKWNEENTTEIINKEEQRRKSRTAN